MSRTSAGQAIYRPRTGGRARSFFSRIRHKDGALHDLEVNYTPHLAANGQLQGFVIFVRDVSEENRARELARNGSPIFCPS